MIATTHSARVTGPLCFWERNVRHGAIPLGPCFLEECGDGAIALFWGMTGQFSAVFTALEMGAAINSGNLVLLD